MSVSPAAPKPTNAPESSWYAARVSTTTLVPPIAGTLWQAAQLVDKRLLVIPGHHVVHNALAREGVYLRSDPDETTSDNLLS